MNNETDISLKFTNSVTGQTKLEQYAKTLETMQSLLNAIDTGKLVAIEQAAQSTKQLTSTTTKQNTDSLGNSFKTAFNAVSLVVFAKTLKNVTTQLFSFTKLSSSYIENLNLFDVAFNNADTQAQSFVNTMSEMYGMDESNLVRTVGIFKQLANAMGVSQETGTSLSEILTQMSADISSLYNVDFNKAASVLQSALAGQTKPIRGLTGADITQPTLQITMSSYGIDKTVSQLSYAEKRLIIVTSLINQLKASQGDYGRTVESVANQMKVFNEQITRLGRAIGNVVLPLLSRILPYLNGILMALVEIFNWIAGLLGFNLQDYDYFSGTDDSVNELSDDLGTANDQAQKLKTGLRGFDKLNVITTPSSGTTTTGGIGTGIDPSILAAYNSALSDYQSKLKDIKMHATDIRDNIMAWLGFTKHTDEKTKDVWFTYDGIGKTLKNFIDSFNSLNTLGKVFVSLGLFLTLKNIYDIIKKIGTFALKPVYNILKPMLTPVIQLVQYMKLYTNLSGSLNNGIKAGAEAWAAQATAMDKAKTALVGISTALIGISLIIDAFKSISDEGFNFNNVLTLIIGSLALAGGAVITLTALLQTMSVSLSMATAGISIVVGLIAGVAAGMINAKKSTDDYNTSLQDANKTAQQTLDTSLLHIQRSQELTNELQNLISANGEVKDSDALRVNFILNDLNNAYGLEYSLIDGKIYKNGQEISSNDEIIKSIQQVIDKKKAEAVVNAFADVYNEALRQQNDIEKKAIEIQNDNTLSAEQKRTKLQELKKQYDTNSTTITNYENLEAQLISGTNADIDKAMKTFYDDSKTSYDQAFGYLKTSADNTKNYCDSKLGRFTSTMTVDTTSFDNFAKNFNNSSWQKTTGLTLPPLSTYRRYKNGLNFVPSDYYPAFLDYGERVLTKEQNQDYNRGIINGTSAGQSVNATFIIQVGNKEIATQVLNDLQDMAKSNGKPIRIEA